MSGTTKKTLTASIAIGTVYKNGIIREKTTTRQYIALKSSLLSPFNMDLCITLKLSEKGSYIKPIKRRSKSKDDHIKLQIVIGGKGIEDAIHLPSVITKEAIFRSYIPDIKCAILAFYYHEQAHARYTDMVCDAIINYKDPKYIGFQHDLFNILEDNKIEPTISIYCREHYAYDLQPSKLFAWLINKIFRPQCDTYVDNGDVASFLNYLLLVLRCGKKAIKNPNAIFEKYQADLMPMIKGFFAESNGTQRIYKSIALGEWIIENIKEFDWSTAPMPSKSEIVSGSMAGSAGTGMPMPMEAGSAGEDIPEKGSGTVGETGSSSDGKAPEEGDDGTSKDGAMGADPTDDKDKEAEEKKTEEDDKSTDDGRPPLEDCAEDEEIAEDVFNDFIREGNDHEWIIAKDECEYDEELITKLDEQIEEFNDTINDVSKFLTLFKDRIKPHEVSGFRHGKFDVQRAMRNARNGGYSTKLFKQSVRRGEDADLAVSLLCDNSGSMNGTKSKLCSRAALVLAQACDWAGIPFECNAFTKESDGYGYPSFTIVEKSFDDSFTEAKPFFGINDSSLLNRYISTHQEIYTFGGNSEEVNIYYIWKQLQKVNHKTKLLIVMCDGETLGSKSDLKDIVRRIESEDGIIVIGIGIMCRTVADIYPHHKLFNSEKELAEDLAPYLVDIISKYAI